MAVPSFPGVPVPRRSAERVPAEAVGPTEILPIRGSAAQVAAAIARLINAGWSFDTLPRTHGGDLWLVSGRRPAVPVRLPVNA